MTNSRRSNPEQPQHIVRQRPHHDREDEDEAYLRESHALVQGECASAYGFDKQEDQVAAVEKSGLLTPRELVEELVELAPRRTEQAIAVAA